MTECELLDDCMFFQDKLSVSLEVEKLMKKHFCRGIYAECARYKIFKAIGREKVPLNLSPSDLGRVYDIIAEK